MEIFTKIKTKNYLMTMVEFGMKPILITNLDIVTMPEFYTQTTV